MLIQNVTPTEYQGISSVGFDINTMVSAPISIAKSIIFKFLGGNIIKNGVNFYNILNILFLVLLFIILVMYIIKNKIYKRISNMIFFICCVIGLPIASYCWLFTSSGVQYANRMLESVSLLIVLFLIILDDLNIKKFVKNSLVALIVIMIINNGLMANICYFYMQQENDATLSMATEMVSNIHKLGKDNDSKLFISGSRINDAGIDDKYDNRQIFNFYGLIQRDLLFGGGNVLTYLNNSLNCNFTTVSKEEKDKILASSEYKNMKLYPSKGSIKIIDDVVVIKYAEPDVN